METDHSHSPGFQSALEEFKKDLNKRDQENFHATTREALRMSIAILQAQQHAQRRLQNLNRLLPFLTAIEQYGEVVQGFCDSNEIMAFIWGPVKVLIEAASSVDLAFGKLLDTYERIGKALPLLLQYRSIFQEKPHMVQILVLIYRDIIKLHQIALRQFRRRRQYLLPGLLLQQVTNGRCLEWEKFFDETWDTCKSRLFEIISDIARRRSLIESQADCLQIEEPQESPLTLEAEERQRHQRLAVGHWLRATNPDNHQYRFSRIRQAYPGTGKWLLDNQSFREWFDPRYPIIPPLLWLKGSPGAGKTILASFVVEEARNLTPSVTVLFFYCKHDQPEKNTFHALARSFLLQLLRQDKDLLTYLYRKCCDSGEALLTSQALLEELLAFAFRSCERTYIIIDGLDECERSERKAITQWFRKLIETLPATEPDRLRCLFVSQDDGVGRKDLDDLVSIKIGVEDNKEDILEYSRAEAGKLAAIFDLSRDEASGFAVNVADAAQGMFLLAKLVWINLLGQTSLAGVERQLNNNFPSGINEAYERVLDRMIQQASPVAKEDILWLLGWLVCAKRSLKWHEIQILKSIDLDAESVELERNKFRVAPKDLCESLVEIQADGTLELVHVTAKFFLVENKRYVDATAKELELACCCIDYLNLPAFEGQPTDDEVLKGEYGFMDYAVLHWVRHLEAGTVEADGYGQLISDLVESLESFISQHWKSPTATLPVSDGIAKRLRYFQSVPFYDNLVQAVASSKKQLRFLGEMRKGEIALNLEDTLCDVRAALERLLSSDLTQLDQQRIEERYGSNLFKCPRFSCQFFTIGFPSAQDRDKHFDKHTRPFRCREEACTGFTIGFSSESERDKHVKHTHATDAWQDKQFPTDAEVAQSI
ncbi:P-loop containing nucleoside triphosphate hydrolase [Fusarium oxysporum f. sp. vasinfectum]|nr:P-loop containing nucleoside triphosphate hydrolase [Fusarium oxysporum f. sp. vasinfectum]